VIIYADTEAIIKTWLLDTEVAPLLQRPDGNFSIYNAMPAKSPIPALIAWQVSGGPAPRKDLPEQQVRMQFDCWGKTRAQAGDIARTLIAELEDCARTGGRVINGTYLGAAATTSMRWLPEPDSDTPRYIVDALITTVT
jgi:hypothetical protein